MMRRTKIFSTTVRSGFLQNGGVSTVKFSGSTEFTVVQPDGKILIVGDFNRYNGIENRNYLVRLNSDGTVDEAFCANINNKFNPVSAVYSIALQTDGKILIGGDFYGYGGVAGRTALLRLNSDGTVDEAFCATAVDGGRFSNEVRSIVVQVDGKILVGGFFYNYGSVSGRNNFIRLNSDGTLDTAFCNNATDGSKFGFFATIYSINVQADGKILVGGDFYGYGGTVNRNALIRLNANGTLDTTFCNNATDGAKFNTSGIIYSIALQSDGKILVAGDFTSYAGTVNRNQLIRLNSNGTLDTAFCGNAVDGNKFTATVRTVRVQSDGKILVGGHFSNYGGTTNRNRLIRLNSDGTLDTAFCVNASDGNKFSSYVSVTSLQSDNKILVGGDYVGYSGNIKRSYFLRLNSDGTTDEPFCSVAVDSTYLNDRVLSIETKSDGKVLLGGGFTNYGGTFQRNFLVQLNSNGTVDSSFCGNAVDGFAFNNYIYSIATQSDGKVLIGGYFTNYKGVANRNYLVRLNSDGTLDTAFCATAVDGGRFNAGVEAIKVQSDGKILVAGGFTHYGGILGRSVLIRLNSNGSIDTAFCNNASDGGKFIGGIISIALQTDGKILIGGDFYDYGGVVGRNRLIRLNSDGTLDTAFCVNAVDNYKFNNQVLSIAVQTDGKVLVAGTFIDYNNTTNRNGLVRFNSTGTLDTAFCNNASDGAKIYEVRSVVVQPDGKILVGGDFASFNGLTNTKGFVRLNSNGTLDSIYSNNYINASYPNYRTSWRVQGLHYSTFNNSIFIGSTSTAINGDLLFGNYGTLIVYDNIFNVV